MTTPNTSTTATLQEKDGTLHVVPLLCSFSKTIGGETFVFVVTRPLGYVRIGDEQITYIVSERSSGCKCGPQFQTTMREGLLPFAQKAIDDLIEKYGAPRVRSVLAGARAIKEPTSNG